jgi:AcrR family transcriptional regulator
MGRLRGASKGGSEPADAALLDAAHKALELRIRGASTRDIAKALGVSVATAHRAIHRGMDALAEEVREDAHTVRDLEVKRLDNIMIRMYSQAMDGNQGAVDRMLRIMERRSKLLGLDAPTQQTIQHSGLELNILPDRTHDEE